MSKNFPLTVELPDFVLDYIEDAARADIHYFGLNSDDDDVHETAMAKRQEAMAMVATALMGLTQGANVGGSLAEALVEREDVMRAHRQASEKAR